VYNREVRLQSGLCSRWNQVFVSLTVLRRERLRYRTVPALTRWIIRPNKSKKDRGKAPGSRGIASNAWRPADLYSSCDSGASMVNAARADHASGSCRNRLMASSTSVHRTKSPQRAAPALVIASNTAVAQVAASEDAQKIPGVLLGLLKKSAPRNYAAAA
jgi:hypothetical protein